MGLGGFPNFNRRNLLYGGDENAGYIDWPQYLNANAMGGGLPGSPDGEDAMAGMTGGLPFDPASADAMAGGLPANPVSSDAMVGMSGGLPAIPGSAPLIQKSDPMGDYRKRADELYQQFKKRSRIESLLTIIQPLAKSFGAAMAQPKFRRNRVFWGTLAGEGASTGLQEAMRPRVLKQQANMQAMNELYRMAQLKHQERLAAGSQTLHSAIDNKTKQRVFITTEMQQAEPSRYSPPEREETDKLQVVTDPVTGAVSVVDAREATARSVTQAPVGGPPVAATGQLPTAATQGLPQFAVGVKKPEAKQTTLDQEFAAAVDANDEGAQVRVLKALRRKAVATHISEPKGPTAAEERDRRQAAAFDAARVLLDETSPSAGANADPVVIFKEATKRLYERASGKNVSPRTKASVKLIEQELYRQLTLRFREKAQGLAEFMKAIGMVPAEGNAETE